MARQGGQRSFAVTHRGDRVASKTAIQTLCRERNKATTADPRWREAMPAHAPRRTYLDSSYGELPFAARFNAEPI
jgi:hypothetical protein